MSGDWRADLKLRLEDFVDEFVVRGAKQAHVYVAIKDELERLRAAYDRDPDPAEDQSKVIDEPSNDWPAPRE